MSVETNNVAEPVVNTQEQTSQPISTENEINWKKFREDRAIERKAMSEAQEKARQKEEEATALKAALEAVVNKPSYASQPSQDVEESEDQRLDRLIEEKWNRKQKQEAEQRAKQESQELPHKMKHAYSDFDAVCSQENIDFMEYHHPEIYRALKRLPDTFDNWSDIYKTMKKLIPNTDSKSDAKKAEKNFNKPQSMNVGGASQTGDMAPKMLTDEMKAARWRDMQRRIKGG